MKNQSLEAIKQELKRLLKLNKKDQVGEERRQKDRFNLNEWGGIASILGLIIFTRRTSFTDHPARHYNKFPLNP